MSARTCERCWFRHARTSTRSRYGRRLGSFDNAIGNSDGWSELDTYAGFCDGLRWVEMVEAFEAAARRHRECGPYRNSAAEVADRMAATTHDVMPDQMMAASGILVAEWHDKEDWDSETSVYCRAYVREFRL
jgi:hypothetical protein